MAYAMLVNPIDSPKKKERTKMAKAQKKAHKAKPAQAHQAKPAAHRRAPVVIQGGKVVDMEKAKKKRKKNPDAMKMMAAEMTGGAVLGVGAMIGMDYAQTFVPMEYVAKINPKALPLIKGGVVSGLAVIVAKVAKNKRVKAVAASAAVASAGVALYDTAQAFIAQAALDAATKNPPALKGGSDTIQTDYNWDFSQSAVREPRLAALMRAPMNAPMNGPLPANGPLTANAPLGAAMHGYDESQDITGNY